MGGWGGGGALNVAEAVGEEVGCFDFGLRVGELGGFVVHLGEVYRVIA